MFKAPIAGKAADRPGLFTDANWWLFCLLILALSFFLLALDPQPKLVLGDSGSYLHTALRGWVPPDRSFLYGYVIRWLCLATQSLTPLLVLQALLGATTAILVAVICRSIFGLSFRLCCLFGLLCSLDPLQLLWQRYVMTETISLFFYVFTLVFSFLYLKERRLWQLVASLILSVLVISFRMSYLLVVLASAVLLPVIAFWPEIREACRRRSPAALKGSAVKSVGVHFAVSALLTLALLEGYRQINGALARREPGLLHASGFTLLATWAPALQPTDSPDARLASLVAEGGQFRIREPLLRTSQLYQPGYLVSRWKEIEPDLAISNRVAKQTALHALIRRPLDVAALGVKTFWSYWNFHEIHKEAKYELGQAGPDLPESITSELARRYHFAAQPLDAKRPTLLQRHFVWPRPYYYVVLLSPLVCGGLIFFVPRGYVFLLLLHSSVLFGTVTLLTTVASVRYLQPMSLLTILIFAVLVKAVIDWRARPTSRATS